MANSSDSAQEASNNDEKLVAAYSHYLWHLAAIGLFDHIPCDEPESPEGESVSRGGKKSRRSTTASIDISAINEFLSRNLSNLRRAVRDEHGNLNKVWKFAKADLFSAIWKGLEIDPDTVCNGDENSSRVAIIDVGIYHHPGIFGRILKDVSIDFSSSSEGTIYSEDSERSRTGGASLFTPREQENIADLLGDLDYHDLRKYIDWSKLHPKRKTRNLERSLNTAHGTAAAGLIGGFHLFQAKALDCATSFESDINVRQGRWNQLETWKLGEVNDSLFQIPLPYFGVDPSAKFIPVLTSHAPDADQLIKALLYAFAKADVILFPRDVGDPVRSFTVPEPGTECDEESQPLDSWKLLRELFLSISKKKPLICAAGNSGESQLIYPASLASDTNGSVISVGAVTYRGLRAGYSNYGDGLTVVAPSGDSEVNTRHQLRLDVESDHFKHHKWDEYLQETGIEKYPYSPQEVWTLDIPGEYGYTAALAEDETESTEDSLTTYNGTSAAAAIVAGIVSLYCRSEKIKGVLGTNSGTKAKQFLKDSADTNNLVGTKDHMRVDINNDNDASKVGDKSFWFGSGLVKLNKLLEDYQCDDPAVIDYEDAVKCGPRPSC